MSCQTRNLTRLRKQRWVILLSLAALTAMLLVYGATPLHAQEPAPQAPPGDCWNGALSGDPLHCYILEEAQRAGQIEVDAVYLTPGGGALYIFLRQDGPISDQVSSYFRQKAYEFMESPPGYGRYKTSRCDGFAGDERNNCLDQLMGWPMWSYYESYLETGLPRSRVYQNILLFTGGPEARRSEPGWASWRQVWPVVEEDSTNAAVEFDVSDVDVTNFPELDCVKEAPRFTIGGTAACLAWKEHGSGIAGWRFSHPKGSPLYIQVKPASTDEEYLDALKGQLVPPHLKANYEAGKFEVVIIPVKYEFGELGRWSVILNRFAVSAGNTVGITSAEVGGNHGGYRRPVVWPLADLKKVNLSDTSEIRETIVVWALDPQVAAAALPQLLPKLGIPLDAVGVVAHAERFVEPVVPAGASAQRGKVVDTTNIDSRDSAGAVSAGSSGPSPASAVPSDVESDSDAAAKATTDTNQERAIAAEEPATGRLGSGVDISKWVIAGGGGALVIAFLVAVIALTARLRRRRA